MPFRYALYLCRKIYSCYLKGLKVLVTMATGDNGTKDPTEEDFEELKSRCQVNISITSI